MINVGFIGCGGIAQKHMASLKRIPYATIASVCDIDEQRLANVSRELGCEGFADYTEMLEKENLDAIFVTVPPFAHGSEVSAVAERGLGLFIEKPISLDSQAAWDMVEVVHKHRITSQVGFNHRMFSAVQQLKQELGSGRAGRPATLHGRYWANSLHSPWWRIKERSGGQLVEQAIHTIDLTRYLFGNVKSVFCQMDNLLHKDVPDFTSEDICVITLQFENGAMGTINVTDTALPNQWASDMWVTTETMTSYLDLAVRGASKNKMFYLNGTPYIDQDYVLENIDSNKDTHFALVKDFIDALVENRRTVAPIEEGALSLDVTLAANESAASGKLVALDHSQDRAVAS